MRALACVHACEHACARVCVSARAQQVPVSGLAASGDHLFVITTVDRSAAQVNCNDNRLITPIKHHWAWIGDTGYSLHTQTRAHTMMKGEVERGSVF